MAIIDALVWLCLGAMVCEYTTGLMFEGRRKW